MDRTPGFLTSMNISWKKDYPWEIAMSSPEGGEDNTMHVLPHVLDVSCGFTPIHDFVPRKSVEESPFIIPGANSGLNKVKGGAARKWLSGNNSAFEPKTPELPPVNTGTDTTGTNTVVTTDNQTTDNTSNTPYINPNIVLTRVKTAADTLIANIRRPLDTAGQTQESMNVDVDGDGTMDLTLTITIIYQPQGITGVTTDIVWLEDKFELSNSVDISDLDEYVASKYIN